MNKKELAEQIRAEQIYDKNISTIYKEHLEFNTRFKGEIIAAIIEAMGKPESLQEIAKLATIEAEKIYADLNNHDCEKDFIDIRGTAISDFVDGAVWGAKQLEAMGVQPGMSEENYVASDNKKSK